MRRRRKEIAFNGGSSKTLCSAQAGRKVFVTPHRKNELFPPRAELRAFRCRRSPLQHTMSQHFGDGLRQGVVRVILQGIDNEGDTLAALARALLLDPGGQLLYELLFLPLCGSFCFLEWWRRHCASLSESVCDKHRFQGVVQWVSHRRCQMANIATESQAHALIRRRRDTRPSEVDRWRTARVSTGSCWASGTFRTPTGPSNRVIG